MSEPNDSLPRRAFVQILGCGLCVGRNASARPSLEYSLAVRPLHAILGDPIVAVLKCVALEDAAKAFSFEDASLELDLERTPPAEEPVRVFPNRSVTQMGSLQVRTAPSGRQQIRKLQRMSRTVELISLYPRWLLDVGTFHLSYNVGSAPFAGRGGPVTFDIASGPAAIPRLLLLMNHRDAGVRARSSGLLHRLTAHVESYDSAAPEPERQSAIARWRYWWEGIGSQMPWNSVSQGASIGVPVPPLVGTRPGNFLGGLAYQRRRLESRNAEVLSSALTDWLRSSSAGPEVLEGVRWVADQQFHYPAEEVMIDPGPEIASLLTTALAQLPSRISSAPMILSTIARMPDQRYVGPLSTLEQFARQSPAARAAGDYASGLLDVLDPGRTPTSGV